MRRSFSRTGAALFLAGAGAAQKRRLRLQPQILLKKNWSTMEYKSTCLPIFIILQCFAIVKFPKKENFVNKLLN